MNLNQFKFKFLVLHTNYNLEFLKKHSVLKFHNQFLNIRTKEKFKQTKFSCLNPFSPPNLCMHISASEISKSPKFLDLTMLCLFLKYQTVKFIRIQKPSEQKEKKHTRNELVQVPFQAIHELVNVVDYYSIHLWFLSLSYKRLSTQYLSFVHYPEICRIMKIILDKNEI